MKRAAAQGGRAALQNPANLLSAARIAAAVALLACAPFSVPFWLSYACGGLSDLLDGFVARRLGLQSDLGARLDSIADAFFAAALAAVALGALVLPAWLWGCAAGIACLHFAAYAVGFCRFHGFFALHTLANKASGALIFAAPLIYRAFGLTATGIILCAVSLYAAAEELLILARTQAPDRDCRGLFAQRARRR